ncbi:MAG: RNA 2',3'-cyclic phosphodiesterase [Chloroflexi bacterium]|nr:RNA 2',3'-cyclic phosphodiesterase [Chloroflexota bacterium]
MTNRKSEEFSDRPEVWRTFAAVPLPEEIQAKLGELQRAFPSQHEDAVRWVLPKSIHLTLRFLGPTDPEMIPAIAKALKIAVAPSGKFQLMVTKAGTFPEKGKPKVLWVGIGGETKRLTYLRGRIQGAFEQAGIEPETRPFEPHLTVGRIQNEARYPADFRAGTAFKYMEVPEGLTFAVKQVVLFRSIMDQRGATYESLAEIDLA